LLPTNAGEIDKLFFIPTRDYIIRANRDYIIHANQLCHKYDYIIHANQ
jgi:uncharacterized C2H2 Zn-finger protein